MTETGSALPLTIILVGVVVVVSILLRILLHRIRVPSLVGFVVLGFLIRWTDGKISLLSEPSEEILGFLAKLGIITLLFQIGLESNLPGLLRQLRRGTTIWAGNVVVAGMLGYAACRWILDVDLIPSLFVATALTATSVGIPVGVWREKKALRSPTGELLVDVAELDDISSIALMAMLFAVVPVLRSQPDAPLFHLMGKAAGATVLKLVAFGGFCTLFMLYVEPRVTRFFDGIKSPTEPMLLIAGIGFILAAVARLLGFSVAIGAFLAGLVFSRDPRAVRCDASFDSLYELFSPFFFIGVGLSLKPAALGAGAGAGVVLLTAAVLGKALGAGLPALKAAGWRGGRFSG